MYPLLFILGGNDMKSEIRHRFMGFINDQRIDCQEIYESVAFMHEALEQQYGLSSDDSELTEELIALQMKASTKSIDSYSEIGSNEEMIFSATKILDSNNQGMIELFEKRDIDLKELEKQQIEEHGRKFY